MGAVHQKFTGDSKELVKELEKARAANVKLEEQNRKLAQQSERTNKDGQRHASNSNKWIMQQVASLGSLAAGYLSVTSALSYYNAEMQKRRDLQKESLNAHLTVGQAQDKVITNFGPATDAELKTFFGQLKGIQERTKFGDLAQLTEAASGLLSSTGDSDRTLSILEAVAPHVRNNPQDMDSYGQAVGTAMKATGINDPNEILALFTGVQKRARFTSYEGFKNVGPVLGTSRVVAPEQVLENSKQAGAIFATIGQLIDDREGGRTRTATANFLSKLKDAAPDLETHFERLAAVQADPKAQATFMKGFEADTKQLVAQMIGSTSNFAMDELKSAYADQNASPEDVARMARQRTNITPEIAELYKKTAAEGREQGAHLGDNAAARTERIRKELEGQIERARAPWTTQWGVIDSFNTSAGEDPELAAYNVLKQQQEMLQKNIAAKTDGDVSTISLDSRSADKLNELLEEVSGFMERMTNDRAQLRSLGAAQGQIGIGGEAN